MLSKSFLSVMIVTSAFTLVFGQTPEAKKDVDKAPKAFAFSFDGGGSYLGVQTQEVNKENFAKFGLKDGSRCCGRKGHGKFARQPRPGLQAGDVIVKFNGEDVTGARKLTRLVSEVDPDHQARITVVRNGR
jgi:serine protease Do